MLNRIKKENSGFTLIEIVVTIVVLATISVPLLMYFSNSLRHSVKTRQEQNAVIAAQGILEELKAQDVDLTNASALLSTASPDPSATPAATPMYQHDPWTTTSPLPTPDADGISPEYTLASRYYVNGTNYKVLAKIKPMKEFVNKAGATKTYGKTKLPTMDSTKDLIATETTDVLSEAKFYFYEQHVKGSVNGVASMTVDEIGRDLKRSIFVDIQPAADPDNPSDMTKYVKAKVCYKFQYNGTGVAGINSSTEKIIVVSENTFVKDEFENIFIFYNPTPLDKDASGAYNPSTSQLNDYFYLKNYDSTSGNTSVFPTGADAKLKLYIIAQDVPEAGRQDGKNHIMNFTSTSDMRNDFNKAFKGVYTNLNSVETSSYATLFSSSVFSNELLGPSDTVSRVANIEVSVYNDDGSSVFTSTNPITTVTGTKVMR